MTSTVVPTPPPRVVKRHRYDPLVKVSKKSPATKFSVGDEFVPLGVDAIGVIEYVSPNGSTVKWSYTHEPDKSYSASARDLRTIIGLER